MPFIDGIATGNDIKPFLHSFIPEQTDDLIGVRKSRIIDTYLNSMFVDYSDPNFPLNTPVKRWLNVPFSYDLRGAANREGIGYDSGIATLFQRYNSEGYPFANGYSKKLYNFFYQFITFSYTYRTGIVSNQTKHYIYNNARFEEIPFSLNLTNAHGAGLHFSFDELIIQIPPNNLEFTITYYVPEYRDEVDENWVEDLMLAFGIYLSFENEKAIFSRLNLPCMINLHSRRFKTFSYKKGLLDTEFKIREDILIGSLVINFIDDAANNILWQQQDKDFILNQIPSYYFYSYLDTFFLDLTNDLRSHGVKLNNEINHRIPKEISQDARLEIDYNKEEYYGNVPRITLNYSDENGVVYPQNTSATILFDKRYYQSYLIFGNNNTDSSYSFGSLTDIENNVRLGSSFVSSENRYLFAGSSTDFSDREYASRGFTFYKYYGVWKIYDGGIREIEDPLGTVFYTFVPRYEQGRTLDEIYGRLFRPQFNIFNKQVNVPEYRIFHRPHHFDSPIDLSYLGVNDASTIIVFKTPDTYEVLQITRDLDDENLTASNFTIQLIESREGIVIPENSPAPIFDVSYNESFDYQFYSGTVYYIDDTKEEVAKNLLLQKLTECYNDMGCNCDEINDKLDKLIAALGANKYAFIDNSTTQARVANLGYLVERIARVLGISVNSDGSIRSIRQSALIKKGDTLPSGWGLAQWERNQGGSSEGQSGGNATEDRDGLAYEIRSNAFGIDPETGEPNAIEEGGYALVENLPQLLHILLDDLDKALGWQNAGANVVPSADGQKIVAYEGLNRMILDVLYNQSAMSRNVIGTHISSLKNQAINQDILAAFGLPVGIKEVEISLEDDKKAVLAVPGLQPTSPTMNDLFWAVLLNLSTLVGKQYQLETEVEGEENATN